MQFFLYMTEFKLVDVEKTASVEAFADFNLKNLTGEGKFVFTDIAWGRYSSHTQSNDD
jgi:hypothetical protein